MDKYFDRKKAFAFGASTLGTAIGMFVFPPVMDIFFRTYGFTGGLLLFGAVTLQGCVASALFYPLPHYLEPSAKHREMEVKITKEQNKTQGSAIDIERLSLTSESNSEQNNHNCITKDSDNNDCKIDPDNHSIEIKGKSFKDETRMRKTMRKTFTACSVLFKNPFVTAMAFFTFAQFYAGYYTAAFAPALGLEKLGISIERASDSVAVFGATDAISKVIGTLTFDLNRVRHYRTYLFALSGFLSSIAAFALPFIRSYIMLLFICGVFGMFHGIPGGQRATILSDLVEPEMMPNALGLMLLVASIGSVVSGISAGRSILYGTIPL